MQNMVQPSAIAPITLIKLFMLILPLLTPLITLCPLRGSFARGIIRKDDIILIQFNRDAAGDGFLFLHGFGVRQFSPGVLEPSRIIHICDVRVQ